MKILTSLGSLSTFDASDEEILQQIGPLLGSNQEKKQTQLA